MARNSREFAHLHVARHHRCRNHTLESKDKKGSRKEENQAFAVAQEPNSVLEQYLHFEGEAHLVLEAAQVDLDHSFDPCLFIDMIVSCLLEHAEKSIINDSGEECILEECDFVNEFNFVICFFRTVTSHCNILEYSFEVRLHDLVEELGIVPLIEVLDQDYFIVGDLRLRSTRGRVLIGSQWLQAGRAPAR